MWEDRLTEIRNLYRNTNAGGADMPTKAKPGQVQPSRTDTAVWMRVLGSWTNRKNGQGITVGNTDFNTDIGYKQDTYGFVGGLTLGRESVFNPNDAASLGLMGGYLESTVRYNQAGTRLHFTGGTAGLSGTYMNGGFFVDVLAKADFLELKLDAAQLGNNLPTTNATTVGGMGNIGYRVDIGRYFIEPVATVTYARTKIDDINTLNSLGANLAWDEGKSLQIAGGSRFGISTTYGESHRIEASITARAWDELLGKNNGLILSGADPILNDNFDKVFGEIKGSLQITSFSQGLVRICGCGRAVQ
jgi:hypothetical protein